MATGTLLSAKFSIIKLPPVGGDEDGGLYAVMIPMGVFVIELSTNVTEPTACALLPPLDISIPF
jgi:hypothetical protein